MSKHAIAIIESNRYVRDGLKLVLRKAHDFFLVGAYSGWDEAVNDPAFLNSQLVLITAKPVDSTPVQVIRWIKEQYPQMLILLYSAPENGMEITRAIMAGAVGFVSNQAPSADLLNTLRLVSKGGSPITPTIARILLHPTHLFKQMEFEGNFTLTSDERCLLEQLAQGVSVNVAAPQCGVSLFQLFVMVRRIYEKIQQHKGGKSCNSKINT